MCEMHPKERKRWKEWMRERAHTQQLRRPKSISAVAKRVHSHALILFYRSMRSSHACYLAPTQQLHSFPPILCQCHAALAGKMSAISLSLSPSLVCIGKHETSCRHKEFQKEFQYQFGFKFFEFAFVFLKYLMSMPNLRIFSQNKSDHSCMEYIIEIAAIYSSITLT